jgi:hypothetical protein
LEFSNLVVGVVGPRGHAPVLPSPSNTDEAGPLPSPEVVLSFGLQAVLEAPRHPAGRTRLRGNTAYTRPSLPGQTTAGPGTARASPVPAPTIRPCRSLYPGGFLTAAPPGSSRRPWPSPRFPRLGSPLSHSRGLAYEAAGFTSRCGPAGCSPQRGFRRWASTPGVAPTPPACYPAPRRLPGPDFHRQADASLCSDQVTSRHHLQTLGTRNFGLATADSRQRARPEAQGCPRLTCSRWKVGPRHSRPGERRFMRGDDEVASQRARQRT